MIMLSCYKNLLLVLLATLSTVMVVITTNAPTTTPSRKIPLAGFASRVAYGFLENRLVLNAAESQTTQWSKHFLAKREAVPHSAPYVVSIQLMTPDEGLVHYCAGTIINENWILTAAHCLPSRQIVENSVIVAGVHDVHAADEAESVQMRHIDHYVRHELYLGGVNPYDIALIYTKTPLKFTKYVQPAQLPQQDTLHDGYGTLYGWGNVSMTIVPNYPHKLQEANMPILDMALCEQVLAQSGLMLHETNLCTGPLTGGVSICTADSGGPLMQCCNYYENSYTVIGIVSWGKMPCGQRNAPSVFVRVSAFTDWIHQIITTATQLE